MALGPQRPGWEHLAAKGRRGSLASLLSAQASDLEAHHTRAYLCCPSAHKTNSCFKLINFWKLGGHNVWSWGAAATTIAQRTIAPFLFY